MSNKKVETCPSCGGSGQGPLLPQKETPHFPRPTRCSRCGGEGKIVVRTSESTVRESRLLQE